MQEQIAADREAWAIAILTARESIETLVATVEAAARAAASRRSTIDVVINGNRALAEAFTARLASLQARADVPTRIRAWFIAAPDKANAWNAYVYDIFPGAELAYFVDGYAAVKSNSLALIAAGLAATPDALGATGVPTAGRSATALREQMLREGGIHGNLCAVRGAVLQRMRELAFRLPLGLYRTDALLGAALCFNLDPAHNDWDIRRILVQPDATWDLPVPVEQSQRRRLASRWKRLLRQAQGVLENRAYQTHLAIRKRGLGLIPRTASELVGSWMDACPTQAFAVFMRNPLCLYAARVLRAERDWSLAAGKPTLCGEISLMEVQQRLALPVGSNALFIPEDGWT